MNDDIRFYDFDFNLLYILPQKAYETGYSSINTTIEFNNSGSVEILFNDDELCQMIKNYKDTIIVIWRDFQGFLTSFNFKKEFRLFGMSLNGLLHRIVVPATIDEKSGDVETLSREALSSIEWMEMGEIKGFETAVTYQTETYMTADKYIQNLLDLDHSGYKIFADIRNKKFIFELIKSKENELIISENNLNAYEVETLYNNKNLAFGGWFKEKQEDDAEGNPVEAQWKYITLNKDLNGIYKIDTVLSSETETEALNELKAKKSIYELTAKTKGIFHNIDYALGDVVRMQEKSITVKKMVNGISMWNESFYGEQPILIEREDL